MSINMLSRTFASVSRQNSSTTLQRQLDTLKSVRCFHWIRSSNKIPTRNSLLRAHSRCQENAYRTLFTCGRKVFQVNLVRPTLQQNLQQRFMSTQNPGKADLRSVVLYVSSIGVVMLGMAYAGVPLYRMFCQATGQGGQATAGHDMEKVPSMAPSKERLITVRFNADISSSMQWNFRPQQSVVVVAPGETALAFYRAKNPSDKPIIGISTYNVWPYSAGLYFNKIQCFCFEEQRLNPHEEVDMPVFFYIDPEYTLDPKLEDVDEITLSYTFFEAKEGMKLPLPGYLNRRDKEFVPA